MSIEQTPVADAGGTEPQTTTTEPQVEPEIDNAAAKKLPWVQKMAQENAEFRRMAEERKAAEAEQARAAEIKKAEDDKNWEQAKKLHEQQLAEERAKYAKEILKRDVDAALKGEGFENALFIKGARIGYNADEHGTPEEYAAALKADPSNALALGQQPASRETHTPPGKPPATGPKPTAVTEDQILALVNSDDRKERLKGLEHQRAFYAQHKRYPGT
jgi:hypothetical protein